MRAKKLTPNLPKITSDDMSAIEALKAARGAAVVLDGNDLLLEVPAAPPPDVLELLTRHKAELALE